MTFLNSDFEFEKGDFFPNSILTKSSAQRNYFPGSGVWVWRPKNEKARTFFLLSQTQTRKIGVRIPSIVFFPKFLFCEWGFGYFTLDDEVILCNRGSCRRRHLKNWHWRVCCNKITLVILSCVIFYLNENEIVKFIISSIMLNKVREHGYATSTHREKSKDSII